MKNQNPHWPIRRAGRLCAFCSIIAILAGGACGRAETAREAWVQRYSNGVGSDDRAKKVVTDANGNVIVAGDSDNGRTGHDFLIIKYSSSGVPLWTNRYNVPGNAEDSASGLAVDRSGNVFVTGSSASTNGNFEYATIKYSASGTELWTNRYNGPGNSDDRSTGVAADGNGNAFVTGYSSRAGHSDYATIAYS